MLIETDASSGGGGLLASLTVTASCQRQRLFRHQYHRYYPAQPLRKLSEDCKFRISGRRSATCARHERGSANCSRLRRLSTARQRASPYLDACAELGAGTARPTEGNRSVILQWRRIQLLAFGSSRRPPARTASASGGCLLAPAVDPNQHRRRNRDTFFYLPEAPSADWYVVGAVDEVFSTEAPVGDTFLAARRHPRRLTPTDGCPCVQQYRREKRARSPRSRQRAARCGTWTEVASW